MTDEALIEKMAREMCAQGDSYLWDNLNRRCLPAADAARWAIVELMGHRIRAGRVQEVELAGGKLLRVDIPTESGDVTEFYSTAALYSLRPCTEAIAREQAGGYSDPRPVNPVDYRPSRQTAITHHDRVDDEPF